MNQFLMVQSFKLILYDVAGIRFLKTASTFGSPTTASSAYFNAATGFNKCKLDSMSLTFPNFGFPTANYNLMAGAATDYDYKLAVGGSVIADTSSGLQSTTIANVDSNGLVTLLSKPSDTVTLTATHKTLNVIDTQQFTIAKWGVLLTGSYNTPTLAQTACGGAGKLFAGNEVSSGTLPTGYGVAGTNSPRILGTLLGEWDATTHYAHFANATGNIKLAWLSGGNYQTYVAGAPGSGVYSNFYTANRLNPTNVVNPWHTRITVNSGTWTTYSNAALGAFCRR